MNGSMNINSSQHQLASTNCFAVKRRMPAVWPIDGLHAEAYQCISMQMETCTNPRQVDLELDDGKVLRGFFSIFSNTLLVCWFQISFNVQRQKLDDRFRVETTGPFQSLRSRHRDAKRTVLASPWSIPFRNWCWTTARSAWNGWLRQPWWFYGRVCCGSFHFQSCLLNVFSQPQATYHIFWGLKHVEHIFQIFNTSIDSRYQKRQCVFKFSHIFQVLNV